MNGEITPGQAAGAVAILFRHRLSSGDQAAVISALNAHRWGDVVELIVWSLWWSQAPMTHVEWWTLVLAAHLNNRERLPLDELIRRSDPG